MAELSKEQLKIKQLEKKLKTSNKILFESQKVAQLGSYDLDVVAGVWTSSKTLEEIFGIPKTYSKTVDGWINIVHPDDKKDLRTYLTNVVLAQKKFFDKEYRILRVKDGKTRWVHGRGRLSFDKKGNPIGMFGTIQDITERKKYEHRLVASEEKFSKAFQQHPTPMQIWDLKNQERLEVNDSTAEFFGVDPDEMLKMDPFTNNFWDDTDQLQDWMKILFAESVLKKMPIRVTTPSGEKKNLLVNASLLDIPDEKIVVVSGLDVTEQLRAEENLKSAIYELEELQRMIEEENLYLKEEIKLEHNFREIIGSSKAMVKMFQQIELVSKTDSVVLIQGETGTGKELVARAIHAHSNRKNNSLVKVNCPALPTELIESELFGHEKGAFTGAIQKKIGRFELANNGTIFLDEIGDLPIGLQAKLLRVLQEGEFERVGSSKTQKVDVRILAATNRDLEQQVLEGTFRQDLYFRLKVFPILCPNLQDRKEDIPALVNHFIARYNPKMGKEVQIINNMQLSRLKSYNWPGNVRELENTIERAMIFSQGAELKIGDWFDHLNTISDNQTIRSLADNERDYITRVLESTSWRIRGKFGAAGILDMKPTTLESRMKKLGIKRPV